MKGVSFPIPVPKKKCEKLNSKEKDVFHFNHLNKLLREQSLPSTQILSAVFLFQEKRL